MLRQIYLVSSALLVLISLAFASSAQSSEEKIYYQIGSDLYSLSEDDTTPEIIASGIKSTIIFSTSGEYGAFQDNQGVWLSRVDDWNPQLIVGDVPSQEFVISWTPDDTRLILRIWGLPENIVDPLSETLAYNLQTGEIETWAWGHCDTLVKQISTGTFALLCQTYEGLKDFAPRAVFLKWGGDYQAADSNDYEILVADLLATYPEPFSWDAIDGSEHVVYIAPNPLYQREDASHSFWEIYSDWESELPSSLESKREPGIERILAAAPNQEQVAYGVRCDGSGETRVCLQIADLSTKEIIWRGQSTFSLPSFFDIDWYSDNSKVVVLGGSSQGHTLYVFDTQNGTIRVHLTF